MIYDLPHCLPHCRHSRREGSAPITTDLESIRWRHAPTIVAEPTSEHESGKWYPPAHCVKHRHDWCHDISTAQTHDIRQSHCHRVEVCRSVGVCYTFGVASGSRCVTQPHRCVFINIRPLVEIWFISNECIVVHLLVSYFFFLIFILEFNNEAVYKHTGAVSRTKRLRAKRH